MATTGNNFLAENTIIRDSFFTPSEKEHTNKLLTGIMHGNNVPRLSEDNIGVANYSELYMKVMCAISMEKISYFKFQEYKLVADFLLGTTSQLENQSFGVHDYNFMRAKASNEVKNIICGVLSEMVEDNKFNEEQVQLVEDYMALLLSSIIDTHMSQELER